MTTESAPVSGTGSRIPDLTGNETHRTRSGRVTKPPTRYEPVEKVEDDYEDDEYDEDESDVGSGVEFSDSELDDEDGDSEMDDFIVEDKSESDEEDNGDDAGRGGAKRPTVGPVRKRPASKK